jgi:GNAT superfamily N-acetyltransferase
VLCSRSNVDPYSVNLLSSDRVFAARLEKAEAANGLEMAHLALEAIPDAAFESIAGGTAIFAGIGSPMTHALGIGMNGRVPKEEMEHLEAFYRECGSPCLLDLCPMADDSVLSFVQSRPYRVIEFNNVLARRIQPDEMLEQRSALRLVSPEEKLQWSRVVSQGFAEYVPVTESQVNVMAATCRNARCWIAGENEPVGGAAMSIQDRVALFFGDAILTGARRKGWQSLLIRERLAAAQGAGCDLAMVSVLPGSGSHRNYERAGFQLIYMRVNLLREFA